MSEEENRYTLSKEERICSEKRIETLFSEGKSFIAYPLRIVFTSRECNLENEHPSVSMMTSVSKKRFKRAVKRNRVKRLTREAYRLNKVGFLDYAKMTGKSLDIAFIYVKGELPTYTEIEKAILKTIIILNEKNQAEIKGETNP